MEQNSQISNSTKSPFYQTRKFWLAIISTLFIVNIYTIYSANLAPKTFDLIGYINVLMWSFGAGVIPAIYATVINTPPHADILTIILFLPFLIYALKQIFIIKSVTWASVLSILMISSTLLIILLSAV